MALKAFSKKYFFSIGYERERESMCICVHVCAHMSIIFTYAHTHFFVLRQGHAELPKQALNLQSSCLSIVVGGIIDLCLQVWLCVQVFVVVVV